MGIEIDNNPRIIEVYNKSDRLSGEVRASITEQAIMPEHPGVVISAITGDGLDALSAEAPAGWPRDRVEISETVSASDGADIAWIYRNAEISGPAG